jgi:hypothetical protein
MNWGEPEEMFLLVCNGWVVGGAMLHPQRGCNIAFLISPEGKELKYDTIEIFK